MTAQELGDEVLKLLNVVAESQTPSTAQRATVLAIFNAMLDSWNVEGLLSPYEETTSHTLVVGTSSYTIGPTGDFVTTRPIDLTMVMCRDSSNNDDKVDIIDYEAYEAIANKSSDSGKPQVIAYLKLPTNGKIFVWPKPDLAHTLRITAPKQLAQVVAGTSIDNNPGYLEGMKYNLATRVATHYRRELTPFIVMMSNETLRILKRASLGENHIAPVNSAVSSMGGNSGYNINLGQ